MVSTSVGNRSGSSGLNAAVKHAGGDVVAWAAATAGRLLADHPDRWLHTQRVATNAWWVAAGLARKDREQLVAAAYLHDIGYAADLVQTGFHPLDGARYLHRHGQPELACLVAHHSGAAVEARHRGLGDQLAAFPYQEGSVADALTYCDVTSGPRGDIVDPGPRFAEIVDRHGSDSIVARSRAEARVQMYVAVVRTLRRVAQARRSPEPFTVTPLQLGCTLLLRLQGTLEDGAAVTTLRAAIDDAAVSQHAVVVDLALVTSLSPQGAAALAAAGSPADRPVTLLLEPETKVARTLIAAGLGPEEPPRVSTCIADALVPHCDSA